jgi:hypothetical protein
MMMIMIMIMIIIIIIVVVSVGRLMKLEMAEEIQIPGKNLPKFHSAYHKSHTT